VFYHGRKKANVKIKNFIFKLKDNVITSIDIFFYFTYTIIPKLSDELYGAVLLNFKFEFMYCNYDVKLCFGRWYNVQETRWRFVHKATIEFKLLDLFIYLVHSVD